MGCLTSTRRAEITAIIAKLDAQILRLETSFDTQLDNIGIDEFRFDSGDGSQKTKYRDPMKTQELLTFLYSRRNRYQGMLDGNGIVSIGLRRQRGGTHGRRSC